MPAVYRMSKQSVPVSMLLSTSIPYCSAPSIDDSLLDLLHVELNAQLTRSLDDTSLVGDGVVGLARTEGDSLDHD